MRPLPWLGLTVGALALLGGCTPSDESPPPGMDRGIIELVDARGDTVRMAEPAGRILSLVPSATSTLLRLGATSRLVGRTDYDTASALADLPSVGGGLGPNLEIVRTLQPDLVVAFAGDSDPRTTEGLAAFGIPVLHVRPDRLRDVAPIVELLGRAAGAEEEARRLVDDIGAELDAVRAAVGDRRSVNTAYLLGGSPPLAAGPGTFIVDLVELAGGRNVLGDLSGLYAPVSPEVLRSRPVEVVLMGEDSRVDPRILENRRVETLPSWVEIPGPQVAEAAWLVARALHPDLSDEGS